MPDDPRKPPLVGVPVVRISERASARGHKDHARKISESDASPPFVDEDLTGKFDGDELDAMRALRPTEVRLLRLEKKHDSLDAKVDRIEVMVAGMGGEMKIMPRLVDAMEKATAALHQRDHVTFTAKVDVDKAKAMDELDAGKAQRDEVASANKAKREWVTKALAIGSSIAAVVATAVAAGRC